MFDLLMLMVHKQSYVSCVSNVMFLNICRYSNEIAVFDMSTVTLHNTFKTTTPLVDAILSFMKRCDSFCYSV